MTNASQGDVFEEKKLSSPHSAMNKFALVLVLFTMLGFTYQAWRNAADAIENEAQSRFSELVQETRIAIDTRMTSYAHVLRGAAGLFAASGHVSRQNWHSYVKTLSIDSYYPGILGLGYATVVAPEKRDALVAAVRAEGHSSFTIRPPGDRAMITSILYLEPFNAVNQRAFGYDMFSEATRRTAMERARDTGVPSMSGKVTLLQENSEKVQAGMLLYMPVYRNGMPIKTVAERRAALQGFTYSPFRMDDLMRGVLGSHSNPLIDLHIFDGPEGLRENLMHDSNPAFDNAARFKSALQVNVAGHTWTMHMYSTPQFEAEMDNGKPLLILLGGLTLTMLLVSLLWIFATAKERALRIARRMTTDLRDSQERYARAVSGTNDGIWELNLVNETVYYSPRFLSLLGYQASEFPATAASFNDVVHPDDRMHVETAFKAHWKLQAPLDVEFRALTKSQGYRYFRVKAQAIYGADGKVQTMSGAMRDVTERKQADVALRESEQRFRALVESAPVGIFLTDSEGICVLVNGRWSALTGLSLEKTSQGGWMQTVHPGDRPTVLEKWERAVQHGHEFNCEFRFVCADREVWVSSQAVLLHNQAGDRIGFIGSIFDLTERMRIETLKNEFISTVSHELRTPLTSIRGALGLIVGGTAGAIPAAADQLLMIASNNCERLVRLINDILDIEKLESGNLPFNMQACELQRLVDQAISDNQSYAGKLGVNFKIAAALPGAMAMLDEDRIIQVLTNLLSNAAKFSPVGTNVEVSLTRTDGLLRLEIRDHGEGVPVAFQDRIFQKFAQADASDTRAKGGTGLGLSISKAIIERVGGTIGYQSAPGYGTVFYFAVPEIVTAPDAPDVRAADVGTTVAQ